MSTKNTEILPPDDDIIGVKPQVAQKVYEMLKQGKRHFGVSGAYMTHQVFDPKYLEKDGLKKEVAKEMLEGERDTSKAIKEWLKDKPNAVMIESVKVPDVIEEAPDETGVINGYDLDCVILFGAEAILIDTKRWKKKKNYTLDDDGNALMTGKPFDGNEIRMKDYIENWLDYLSEDACLTGLVCVNSEEAIVTRTRNWYITNYRLVEIDRFIELLDAKMKEIDEQDLNHINSTLVAQFLVRCVKPYDEMERVFNMNQLRNFK